ncbi:hypothetical protein CYLTODRAFT_448050 [Cylindrobasidium torrendii FP15055 ss-10]|uniref:L domain-like protein n=1 Tax=Cylindrobasidium torrendii FP15055 ss-10 TaxID=1314674 RepID=A0A0D7BUW2_9AGAR|nr:hypothetical protein CYLTODRAFT_448050 [Cylindrobasidium torrendii FP15055 ss-10]
MSRLPLPTSRSSTPSTPRTPTAPTTPTSTTRARGAATLSPSPTPRTRATSTLSPEVPRPRTKSTASAVPRTRTTSTVPPVPTSPKPRQAAATKSPAPKPKAEAPSSSAAQLSIREAIALKRAEARKIKTKSPSPAPEDQVPPTNERIPEDDLYGRQSVKETVERARSTGLLNLATRNLPCIPSILFEAHLNVTPEPLQSVPEEPPYGVDSRKNAAWYEGQDLKTIKMGNNEVVEIQPEISLFGSLKSLDMHKNKLQSVPATLADLLFLSYLDLSHNNLTSLPDILYALPELTVLNVAHNALTDLRLGAYFADGPKKEYVSDDFFATPINRATSPLPNLVSLNASNNKLKSGSIDFANLPTSLKIVDLSHNPLGIRDSATQALVRKLAELPVLDELHLHHAEIGDDAFPADMPSSSFAGLHVLQIEECPVTQAGIKAALQGVSQKVTFDITNDLPPPGTLRVAVGKIIVKEAWELEAERRQRQRRGLPSDPEEAKELEANGGPPVIVKEYWEYDADNGLLTEGGRRRARAEAEAKKKEEEERKAKPTEPVKEAWEVEGLFTEGAKRRARAEAASKAQEQRSGNSRPTSPVSLSSPQYWDATTKTLTLPPSTPPAKGVHGRHFSLALGPSVSASVADIVVPTPTLPLTAILKEGFADNLTKLILVNRRLDRCFSLLPEDSPCLPNLEELDLEGCSLGDHVAVVRSSDAGAPRTMEALLPLIARLFPSLHALNLAFNSLPSECLTSEALSTLITCTSQRAGLRRLGLRGNGIRELDGFKTLADGFKGHRDVPGWKLDELDLRDNDIGKIPPELGLLPLGVFLVDGNTFRVPPRRVWEREGTKGLLNWLRGRIE